VTLRNPTIPDADSESMDENIIHAALTSRKVYALVAKSAVGATTPRGSEPLAPTFGASTCSAGL